MSRAFLSGSNEHLTVESTPVTTYPLTIACWFNPDDVTTGNNMVSIADASASNKWFSIEARGDASDVVRARVSTGFTIATSTSYTANAWHHACGVFTSSSDVSAFLNGGGEGNGNPASTPTGLDRISIGRIGDSTPSNYMEGKIAEVGIWNVALTNAEVLLLSKGYSPLFVRPSGLVFYAPLVRDNDEDIVGGLSLTPGGTPTVGVHSRIFNPIQPFSGFGVAAAPPASTKNPWYAYAQQ